MRTDEILSYFHGVTGSKGQYRAKCPSHGSQGKTLSIKECDDRTVLHCFAGCTADEILGSIGLKLTALYFDEDYKPTGPTRKQLQERSFEDMFIEVFKSDVSRGVKPSNEDKIKYRQLINKKHRGAA